VNGMSVCISALYAYKKQIKQTKCHHGISPKPFFSRCHADLLTHEGLATKNNFICLSIVKRDKRMRDAERCAGRYPAPHPDPQKTKIQTAYACMTLKTSFEFLFSADCGTV
jgi:hypothetical protein